MRSTEHGTPEPSEPSPESSPFDKAPWLFQKGNKMGAGRRDMARERLEHPAWESRDGPREILGGAREDHGPAKHAQPCRCDDR